MSCPCGKNARQRLYCHRSDCGTLAAVDLPPPTVEVTSAPSKDSSAPPGSVDIVISRDGKGRSYRTVGGGPTDPTVVKDGIEKILGDHYSGEWIPKG